MTYKQTIDFLYTSLPMFQRIGDAAIKKDLVNIIKLCALLGNPHQSFPSIHVAGTNGKGSVSHMLASIFQASGKKVGLYTSPHYIDFRERIKINGAMINKSKVVRFVDSYKKEWEKIKPSFFEITVAMAFDHFRNEKVDIAIIETGLGGRLDSTNIIMPLLSVITNIGFDHTAMLGNTLQEIAFEKAGIIKQNIPVVVGEWKAETAKVFQRKAGEMNAPVCFASRNFSVKKESGDFKKQIFRVRRSGDHNFELLETDLAGPYQLHNIRTVLTACKAWNNLYPERMLKSRIIKEGLKNVRKNTNFLGRWMVICKKPLVITDAAHNVEGMENILPELRRIQAYHKHYVLGFVADKDIHKVLRLFPKEGFYYWCAPGIPRGKPADETQEIGKELGLIGDRYKSVGEAYKAAFRKAKKRDLIFVGGSSYVAGDFLAAIKKE